MKSNLTTTFCSYQHCTADKSNTCHNDPWISIINKEKINKLWICGDFTSTVLEWFCVSNQHGKTDVCFVFYVFEIFQFSIENQLSSLYTLASIQIKQLLCHCNFSQINLKVFPISNRTLCFINTNIELETIIHEMSCPLVLLWCWHPQATKVIFYDFYKVVIEWSKNNKEQNGLLPQEQTESNSTRSSDKFNI